MRKTFFPISLNSSERRLEWEKASHFVVNKSQIHHSLQMVCSIGQPYSKLINYAEENFISKDEAIKNSRWFGRGAEKLGLSGRVNPTSYENAYQGKDDTGNFLRRKLTNNNSRPGRDLTFSAPKSVSLLALVEENKRIINAHNQAVDRTLEYIENNCIYTRLGKAGRNHQQTLNMVTAIFQHHESRNFDPNLHSHCVIFNQTQGTDGKWRTMDNRELYQQRITIGLVYHHELSQQLIEQGYSIDWHPSGTFDLAGVTREQLEQFSSRNTEIIGVAGADASGKEKAIACLSTRKGKKYLSSAERKLLKNSWHLKYQQTISKSDLNLKKNSSREKPRIDLKPSTRELIDSSISSIIEENKTSFTYAELLKESLINSQGQHSLKAIEQEIKQHPRLLPTENNALTTINLYQKDKANRNHLKRPENKSDILKLVTSALSSQDRLQNHQSENSSENNSQQQLLLKDIPDRAQRISQSINNYLDKSRNFSQSRSLILTDTENDKQFITAKVREKLISENILSSTAVQSLTLKSKNLDSQSITQIENYQPGNAIKFNRASKKFSNQHFYKILSVDRKNKVLLLEDRFQNRINLPIHRYKNRELFQVERREIRVNEKLRFERGQYINGKQITSGQSFIVTDAKDKQNITIKINNKLLTVKSDNLFFANYDYVDTLEKYHGKRIDNCIYFPSKNKSKELLRQDLIEAAKVSNNQLSIYLESNISYSSLQKSLAQEKTKFIMDKHTRDNALFEIASSAKYIVLDRDIDNSSPTIKTYNSPDGIVIEKDPENLSISYEGKSVVFDQDYNVLSNEFNSQEIHQLNQHTQAIKNQAVEQNRQQQIQRDIDLDISR